MSTFTPEWGTELKTMLGLETERDAADHEGWVRRKEKASRNAAFTVWRNRFNKRMFGTAIPHEDSDSSDEEESEMLLKEEVRSVDEKQASE